MHAFLLWLTFRDALVTEQKMCSQGYSGRSLCLFCYGKQESMEHLFFSCSFSQRVWLQLMDDCSFTDVSVDWEFVESWGSSMLQGRSLKASLGKLCIGAVVYHLWRQRNDLLTVILLARKSLLLHKSNGRSELECWLKVPLRVKERT